MRINRNLNLVVPIERADGSQVFVHSTPISSDVFDAYFLPIAKTFSAIYSEGLGVISGPRIADKLLRKISTDMGIWEGPGGVQAGLVAEIRRLTNVFVPGKRGWEMVPFDDAKAAHTIEPDDAVEIEAALTFFTLVSAMHRKSDLPGILGGALRLWGSRTESLSCTEFMNSLPTLTESGNSGKAAAA